MRKATTDPTSATAAVDSAGAWIDTATRRPGRALTDLQIVVGTTLSVTRDSKAEDPDSL